MLKYIYLFLFIVRRFVLFHFVLQHVMLSLGDGADLVQIVAYGGESLLFQRKSVAGRLFQFVESVASRLQF